MTSFTSLFVCYEAPLEDDVTNLLQVKADIGVNFISYPLFHPRLQRGDLIAKQRQGARTFSDRLLPSNMWAQNFVGRVSDWIDVDHPQTTRSMQSEVALNEELRRASHLGLRTIILPCPRARHANYARLVARHCETSFLQQQVVLRVPLLLPPQLHNAHGNNFISPLSLKRQKEGENGEKEREEEEEAAALYEEDGWELWNKFRTACSFPSLLSVLLSLEDASSLSPATLQHYLEKWRAEPVKMISLSTKMFIFNDQGHPVLPLSLQHIVTFFVKRLVHVNLTDGANLSVDVSLSKEGNLSAPPLPPLPPPPALPLPAHSNNNAHSNNPPPSTTAPMHDTHNSADNSVLLKRYVDYIKYLFYKTEKSLGEMEKYVRPYWDVLQTPLQPLRDELESSSYETFERDEQKYVAYQRAVARALGEVGRRRTRERKGRRNGERGGQGMGEKERVDEMERESEGEGGAAGEEREEGESRREGGLGGVERGGEEVEMGEGAEGGEEGEREGEREEICIAVLGAGRGPLVQASLLAFQELSPSLSSSLSLRILAVEKNPEAIITLRNRHHSEQWGERVEVWEGDMRLFSPPCVVHIFLSELLGSFGDNELSPECLEGALERYKQAFPAHRNDFICIPERYASYLSPLSAPLHWMSARERTERKGGEGALETPYVTSLHRVCPLAAPQRVWGFAHVAGGQGQGGEGGEWGERGQGMRRRGRVKFTCTSSGVLTGLGGYFNTTLFEEVSLSIVLGEKTGGMESWFPLFFPLSTPLSVRRGEEVVVEIWREGDSRGVWYEWSLSSPVVTKIHNSMGRHYQNISSAVESSPRLKLRPCKGKIPIFKIFPEAIMMIMIIYRPLITFKIGDSSASAKLEWSEPTNGVFSVPHHFFFKGEKKVYGSSPMKRTHSSLAEADESPILKVLQDITLKDCAWVLPVEAVVGGDKVAGKQLCLDLLEKVKDLNGAVIVV